MNPRIGAPSGPALAAILEQARRSAPTYDHVGSTLADADPGRTGERRRRLTVGHGRAAFEAARQGLLTWVPQRGIGITVHPAGQLVEAGATVVLDLRWGPLHVVVPNRVVGVVDNPTRFTYAYGTLPGHDERGEERFSVEIGPDGRVTAEICVHAVAGSTLARLAAPAVRLLSTVAVGAYLRALADHVAQAEGTEH